MEEALVEVQAPHESPSDADALDDVLLRALVELAVSAERNYQRAQLVGRGDEQDAEAA